MGTAPSRSNSPIKGASAGQLAAAAALLLAAPFAGFQAAANAELSTPGWARAWNGFRLADDARSGLSGDAQNPEAGLTLSPGAANLARAAYAREPLASEALFVLALEQAPLTENYIAGPIALEGVRLDKRAALLQLLVIADAAGRGDYTALFAHADVLAASHPRLAGTMLQPLFAELSNPAAVPILRDALAKDPRWAPAFKGYVPKDEAALLNYAKLRREFGQGQSWASDEKLVAAFAARRRYDEAFALWRSFEGGQADPFGFSAETQFAPIGWQVTERGERSASGGQGGALRLMVERGAGGELARQLLQLPAGRYRLETRIASDEADPPLSVTLQCATGAVNGIRQPLTERVEFAVGGGDCPAYWLIVSGSALDSRPGIDATLSDWRFSRIS